MPHPGRFKPWERVLAAFTHSRPGVTLGLPKPQFFLSVKGVQMKRVLHGLRGDVKTVVVKTLGKLPHATQVATKWRNLF